MALQNDPAGYSRSEGCRALGVSRSGLYAELLKPQRPRQLQDRQLSKELSALFAQSRGTYWLSAAPTNAGPPSHLLWQKSDPSPDE